MNKTEFIEELRNQLEIEANLDLNTNFKDLEEWDSLNVMVLISFVSETLGVVLTGKDISEITTIETLISKIGAEKFD